MMNYNKTEIKPITTRQVAVILLLLLVIGSLVGFAIYSIKKNRDMKANSARVSSLRSQRVIRSKNIPKSNASAEPTKFTFILR